MLKLNDYLGNNESYTPKKFNLPILRTFRNAPKRFQAHMSLWWPSATWISNLQCFEEISLSTFSDFQSFSLHLSPRQPRFPLALYSKLNWLADSLLERDSITLLKSRDYSFFQNLSEHFWPSINQCFLVFNPIVWKSGEETLALLSASTGSTDQ